MESLDQLYAAVKTFLGPTLDDNTISQLNIKISQLELSNGVLQDNTSDTLSFFHPLSENDPEQYPFANNPETQSFLKNRKSIIDGISDNGKINTANFLCCRLPWLFNSAQRMNMPYSDHEEEQPPLAWLTEWQHQAYVSHKFFFLSFLL